MDVSELRDPNWTVEQVKEFYGYPEEVLRAFQLIESADDGSLNRFEVESVLVHRNGLLSPKLTASELGLTVESVEAMADFFEQATTYATPFPMRPIGESFVVSKAQLTDWVRELTDYHGIWRSIPGRTAKIKERVEEIYDEEGNSGTIEYLVDVVYDRYRVAVEELEGEYGDTPPVASAWCAITDDPISLPHSEYLSVGGEMKPGSLEPDRVGWHALLEDESLRTYTIGSLTRFHTFEDLCGE